MKETFYFSHDFNARNDGKLVRVMMKQGIAGIGAYWCIVEMLYEEGGVLMQSECERIAFELRMEYDDIIELVNDFDLFEKDNQAFWSKSVLARIDKRNEKSEKARQSAEKRWKDKGIDANALRTQSDSNAIKERKGKEIKEKKNKTDTLSKDTEQAPSVAMIEKEIEPTETYGKEEINMMQGYLRKAVGVTQFKDSKERWYVSHCYNLLKKIGREEFETRLKAILEDDFKSKNCNKLAYLYGELKSFIHSPIVEPMRKERFITSV